jgi:ABC-type ATPase with predicted acetyltransferase domain
MTTYNISKSFNWQGQVTDKVTQVCRMFGLTVDRLAERTARHECQLNVNDGDIVYITGPSGAGKSVLLREMEKSIPEPDRVNLAKIKLPRDKTLIDCICLPQGIPNGSEASPSGDDDLVTGLRTLSIAGLSDCFCILNQPANLSEGQKFRFRLAMALAAKKKFILADEFCSNLDRTTAAVISYNIHRFAKRTGTTFILVSSHDDILLDLAPDVLVIKELCGPTQVIYKLKT